MRKYRVLIPLEIEESIRHLHPETKSKIRAALEEIKLNPDIGKPLKEKLTGLISRRIGDYRIVYTIKPASGKLQVIDIAKRNIVYERVAEKIILQKPKLH